MLHKNKTIYGIYWFVLSLIVSSSNDLITKYLSQTLTSAEITFFRYFFSLVYFIPFFTKLEFQYFKSKYLFFHIIRGGLLFIAIFSWNYSLQKIKLPTATLISFSIPIFTLIFSNIFLKEKFSTLNVLCTFIVFIGLSITLYPYYLEISFLSIFSIVSVICFALLDVFNKKLIQNENKFNMIFYSSLFVVIFSVFTVQKFSMPVKIELFFLAILGMNSNLILYFLLKSFSLAKISTLVPYRYLELLFSSFFAFIFLGETIDKYIKWGSFIIIPTTYLLFYVEQKKSEQNS
ncbi:MAG: DMT family transporter [Rickettsia sp.]|nr:DMT family transporter [Rickettsia sp.]